MSRKFLYAISPLLLVVAGLSLTGCVGSFEESARVGAQDPLAISIHGSVHGGQSPVSGSRIYLYSVALNGTYGSASTSLLNSPGYVVSDATGSWSITGAYPTCAAGSYVYMVALGGNPGLSAGTNNSALALMAGLGQCSSLNAATLVNINEVTTVATAYALAQFITDSTHVGTTSSNVVGLTNAFSTIGNLVNTSTGYSSALTPAGNGTVPQAEINTLANALAACANSNGVGNPCAALMSAATTPSSTPVDTAQVAINIAQNPGLNPSAIFALSTATAPFQPALTAAPADWTMSVIYKNSGIGQEQSNSVAVDSQGNIWTSNFYGGVGAPSTASTVTGTVMKMSPTGVPLSGDTGWQNPALYRPDGIAIDLNDNAWVVSNHNSSLGTASNIQKFANDGTLLSGAAGFTNACLNNNPFGIAVDLNGNIWVAASLTTVVGGVATYTGRLCELNSAGVLISPSTGYTNAQFVCAVPHALAVDASNNIWDSCTNSSGSGTTTIYSGHLNKFDGNGNFIFTRSTDAYSAGVAVDPTGNIWAGGFASASNTTGLLNPEVIRYSPSGTIQQALNAVAPSGLTVDGQGYLYAGGDYTSYGGPDVTSAVNVYSSTGTAISPALGYQIPNGGFYNAVDRSGNLWQGSANSLVETIGLAAPVITPLVKAAVTNKIGTRP